LERKRDDESYNIEDTAQYIVTKFELYAEKTELLKQEQEAWAKVLGGENGEGGLLTEDKEWS
jgi:hypothetical protein